MAGIGLITRSLIAFLLVCTLGLVQAWAQRAVVVSASPLASRLGVEVMARGGNAIDAAVTVAFVLAVVHPAAGNLGGGGFMLIHLAKSNDQVVIDYRERAPLAARRNMYQDEDGNFIRSLSTLGHQAVGVPGTVAGLALALRDYGTISLKQAVKPAIELAQKGFEVPEKLSLALNAHAKDLRKFPASARIFFPRGKLLKPGDKLVQRDLARTLGTIAEQGPDAFYKGKLADLIVAEMKRGGGLITKGDLASYRPVVRKPLTGTYRGFTLVSTPPPSSGGVHLIQMLNILEGFDLKRRGHNTGATVHLLAEVMKRAFADRSRYLGDPDFFPVPLNGLISKSYARKLASEIKSCCATESRQLTPGKPQRYESADTTHFSVLDPQGNAVSNTYTLNLAFGSKVMVEGAGFLLNNEMDDFSAKPGAPNVYGLIGGQANAIAPGKRMLSSMAPTMVFKDGKLALVIGASGGARIISALVQVISNLIDHGLGIVRAVGASRVHHQWLPDRLFMEKGINSQIVKELKLKGHKTAISRRLGITNSIWVDPISGQAQAAPDPRGQGASAGF